MNDSISEKYVAAFDGILTRDDLEKTAAEAGEFEDHLPPLKHIPSVVRHTIGQLSDSAKLAGIEADLKRTDSSRTDLSDVVDKLNCRTFILSGDGSRLQRADGQHLSDLFPKGQKDRWPTLVLLSNSNLASPQSFFDSFQAARQIVPAITGAHDDTMVLVGSYFSQKHLLANTLDTLTRYRELGMNAESLSNMSPAVEVQAYQLLDLLLERDANGAVLVEDHKPLLRADAAEMLKHVVGYGYSAGHMTNKDTFRALRDLLSGGYVQVQIRRNGELITRDATAADAHQLIPNARLIGMAGGDKMELGEEKGMPKEVNFVSKDDFSMSLFGPRFLKAPNIIQVNMQDNDGNPITDSVGGHAENSYVRAVLSNANRKPCEQAQSKLSSGIGIV